jgi:NADH-quinone oxidoreductase subunit E
MSQPVADNAFALSDDARARIDAYIARYPTKASAIMPCIWTIQDELGHVPPAGIEFLSTKLELSHAKVHEVLSFYTMFRTEPQAAHVLQVCHNISCHVMGARPLIAHLEKRLGIRLGETTPDGRFALEGVECLGACGHGPCLQLGKHLYEYLTPEKADDLLESLKRGEIPRADTDRELED